MKAKVRLGRGMRGIAGLVVAAAVAVGPAWGAEISFRSDQGVGGDSSKNSYTILGAIGNLNYGYADFQLRGSAEATGSVSSFETPAESKLTVFPIPGVGLAATGKEKERSTGAASDQYSVTASASAGITTEPLGPDVSLGVGPVSVSWQLPIGISVTTQLNVAIGGDPPSWAGGYAFAQVDDPFHFVNWQPGMALPLELGWGAGFELRAELDGAMERETTWGTNIPGFEELLTVKAVSSLAPGGTGQYSDPANFILEVFVTSNPALGIDNDGVRTSILSSLLYTGFGSFAMMNDVTFFNGGFVPPDGTTEFEFYVKDSVYAWLLERQDPSTFEFTRVSDGGEAPEPGTWALMGTGLAGLAWRKRRGTQA